MLAIASAIDRYRSIASISCCHGKYGTSLRLTNRRWEQHDFSCVDLAIASE
jgi:hypothetical protein